MDRPGIWDRLWRMMVSRIRPCSTSLPKASLTAVAVCRKNWAPIRAASHSSWFSGSAAVVSLPAAGAREGVMAALEQFDVGGGRSRADGLCGAGR